MFNKKLNILVTGAKGQLGSYLVNFFKNKSFHKHSRIGNVFGIDLEDLDIRNTSVVADFFNKNVVNPPIDIDYVIHCAAATDTSAIEKDPEKYYAVNCLGPKNIAHSCVYNGIKLIFISSDYVLSENSPVVGANLQEFPVNQYGLQKLIAEQFVKEAYKDKPKDLMILRSSWMFGNSENSFVEKFLKNAFRKYADTLKDENPKCKAMVQVANDAYGRPTPVWFIADTIETMMLQHMHGTMNLQYPCKQISRYEWACMIWDAFVNTDSCLDENAYEVVNMLRNGVEIMPMASKGIGVQMHHPGKVNDGISNSELLNSVILDTKVYVGRNIMKYIDMAKKIIMERQ